MTDRTAEDADRRDKLKRIWKSTADGLLSALAKAENAPQAAVLTAARQFLADNRVDVESLRGIGARLPSAKDTAVGHVEEDDDSRPDHSRWQEGGQSEEDFVLPSRVPDKLKD